MSSNREYQRKWEYEKHNNPETAEKYRENKRLRYLKYRYGTKEGRIRGMISNVKARCKRDKRDFDLDHDYLLGLAVDTCPLLGIPLNYSQPETNKDFNIPSVDRIDPTKGYVKGNVWIISWRANDLKRDASLDEFKLITQNWSKLNDNR